MVHIFGFAYLQNLKLPLVGIRVTTHHRSLSILVMRHFIQYCAALKLRKRKEKEDHSNVKSK
jgi:hypothetical protein